jgi:1-acyl-sn-glycerol-3-phosphate acyltransferase
MVQPTITACAVVLLLALALVVWIVRSWRRTRFTFVQAILWLFDLFMTRVLWRATVRGRVSIPDGEGAVIVCNHTSGVDPMLVQLATDRVVHWMVAREYYDMPLLRWAFRAVTSIPVNRGGIDTASTKMAIRLAQQGGLVGLFPEGRVNTTSELLLPGRPGAALIALKARVRVIPCFVEGVPYNGTALGSLFMPGKARITVGEPLDLSEYYERDGEKHILEELTRLFLVQIAKLAGVDNFEPRLAGRNWKTGLPDVELNGADEPAPSPAA